MSRLWNSDKVKVYFMKSIISFCLLYFVKAREIATSLLLFSASISNKKHPDFLKSLVT